MHDAKLTELEAAARAALIDTAKDVLKEAQALVPTDDGALRKSGKVEVDDLEVRVVFRAPHAWIQHERLDYQHPDGGQAKYLETPASDKAVVDKLADGVRARLR
jgi:hypothetical protein